MKKYYGNYIGLVVEDQDPEYRNRVKIFVPAISATIFKNLNAKKQDTTIAGIGINLENHLSDEALQELRKILPWAECAAPLFGGGTSTHYNPKTKQTTNKNSVGALSGVGIDSQDENSPEPVIPELDAADSLGLSSYGNHKDSFSGGPLPTSNMLKFVASIGWRETNFNEQEAYSEALNQYSNNSNIRRWYAIFYYTNGNEALWKKQGSKLTVPAGPLNPSIFEKAKALGADYGFYQVNGENSREIGTALFVGSAAEQTKKVIAYINYLSSTKDSAKKYKGVVDVINAGNWSKANSMLNGVWPSLPGGKSHKPANDAGANLALNGDAKILNLAQNTKSVDKTNLTNNSTETGRYLYAKIGSKANEATYDISNSVSTGAPGGIFSTPKVNSHVWVFFNEGDPQYPVYFAQHIVIADWQRLKQVSSPGALINTATDTSKTVISTIQQPNAGGIDLITTANINPSTGIQEENSGVVLRGAAGNLFSLMSTGNVEYAPVNKTTKVAGDKFLTVEGSNQTHAKGSTTNIVGEDYTLVVGDIGEEAVQAHKDIMSLLSTGHERVVKSSEQPSGKTIPCPKCNEVQVVDSGGLLWKLAKKIGNGVLNCLPKNNTAIDFVTEALSDFTTPIATKPSKDIHKKTTCGNINCVNNRIPDYNAHTPEIETASIEYQEGIFNDILKHEQLLGQGGNHTTVVSKNSLTKVGLLINKLDPIAKQKDSFPIKNGLDFINKTGVTAKGDSVNTFKVLDVPGTPTGYYDLIVGSKYNLVVGSRGIHMQTTGVFQLDCAHMEFTSNHLSLGNESGITKINGGAVIIEAKKSITMGGSPTNVHVNGSMHTTANVTAQGSIFANGNLYAKRLIIPAALQRTNMSGTADYTSGLSVWSAAATAAFAKSGVSKKLKHYNPVLHGMYPATGAGMSDILVDWLTQAQTSLFFDNWMAPTGIAYTAWGPAPVFTFPHIHLHHNSSHEHSFNGPEGEYLNDADEIYGRASMCGSQIPDMT